MTTDTEISSAFLRRQGESVDTYLARTSRLSGKTGIAQETVLGKSAERQFVTPAAYERFSEQLPGSMFISEGKVGTFQIKQEPKGLLGKIPGIRSLFSGYTHVDVYKGTYAAVPDFEVKGTSLDVEAYGKSYVKTLSLPSPVVVKPPTVSSALKPSDTSKLVDLPKSVPSSPSAKSLFSTSLETVSGTSKPSVSSMFSMPSMPSLPIMSSKPSMLSVSYKPSVPSMPSVPSFPSTPRTPSVPRFPSKPSFPTYSIPEPSPSPYPERVPQPKPYPSPYPERVPQPTYAPSTPFVPAPPFKLPKRRKGKDPLFGGWRLKRHPIPTAEEVGEKLVGVPMKRRKGKSAKFVI